MKRVLSVKNSGIIPDHIKNYFNTPITSQEKLDPNKAKRQPVESKNNIQKCVRHNFKQNKMTRSEFEPWIKDQSSSTNSSYEKMFINVTPKLSQKRTVDENNEYLRKRLKYMEAEVIKPKKDSTDASSSNNKTFTKALFLKNKSVPSKSQTNNVLLTPIDISNRNYIPLRDSFYKNKIELIRKLQQNLSSKINNPKLNNKRIDIKKQLYFDNARNYLLKRNLPFASDGYKHKYDYVKQLDNPMKCSYIRTSRISTENKNITNEKMTNTEDIPVGMEKKNFKKDFNYDLNYISNNLPSFSSQISDINYIMLLNSNKQ